MRIIKQTMNDLEAILDKLSTGHESYAVVRLELKLQRMLRKKPISELRRLIKSFDNRIIRHHAEFEIWRRKLDRTPKNLLKIIKNCDDEDKVGEAISELGHKKYAGAVDLFITLLKNKNPSVRIDAALALLDNPSQKAFRPLLAAIRKNNKNCSAFVHALEELNCNSAVEFLVDLFISKTDDPMVRINVIDCFEGTAVSKISPKIGERIKTKISTAIRKSKNNTDKYELRRFYEEAVKPKIKGKTRKQIQ